MASKEALEKEIETPMTYISRNDVYYQVPVWAKEGLEVLEILKDHYIKITFDTTMTDEEKQKIKEWTER